MTAGPGRAGRDQRGSASLELVAMVPYLLLAAAFGWQLLLTAYVTTSATNAARTGARSGSLGGDPVAAAMAAIPDPLRGDTTVVMTGPSAVRVDVEVPVLFPGLTTDRFTIDREATFPPPERLPLHL